MAGVVVGALIIEAAALCAATLGDCSGDCTSAGAGIWRSVIIGGRRGVDASSSRSTGSSSGSGIRISRGKDGEFCPDIDGLRGATVVRAVDES